MKTVSADLAALINSGVFTSFDLYTFALAGGGQLLLTTADVDIARAGVTYSGTGPRTGAQGAMPLTHAKIGLDVDQWQIRILPRARDDLTGLAFPDRIGSTPWLQAAIAGVLDAAIVTIERAYFATPPTWPLPPGGAVPAGTLVVFKGQVAEVDADTVSAVLTINDLRHLLTTSMPRNLYQASCRHRLYDFGCQLSAEAFKKVATIGAASTRGQIVAAAPKPGGSGTYQLGRLVLTSGANAGFARTIARWDGAQVFGLLDPLPFTPALGDAIALYPGCDKTMGTCRAFGNILNFGGDPYIPPPETTS